MRIERHFTTGPYSSTNATRFVMTGGLEEPTAAPFAFPDDWSLEAADTFRPALYKRAPARLRAVEENTMPSWMWLHRAQGEGTVAERSVLDVFDRVTGSASYRGWKAGLWDDELAASAFHDDLRDLLLTRRLVMAPRDLAKLGLDWAYGAKSEKRAAPARLHALHNKTMIVQNETIDSILHRGHVLAIEKWEHFLHDSRARDISRLAFADTMAQWDASSESDDVPRACLNLLAFRTKDGSVDVKGLQQATRLAVIFLDLHYDELAATAGDTRSLALGFGNLAALLMSLALPYDSDQARGTAAALAAIITATATTTSAQATHRPSCVSTW